MCGKEVKRRVGRKKASGVIFHLKKVERKKEIKVYRRVVRPANVVWFRESITDKKTRGGAGVGRVKNVVM